jgi:hypothetical protein
MKSVSKKPNGVPHNTPIIVSILVLIILVIDIYVLYSMYKFKKNRESCPCAVTPKTNQIIIIVSILIFAGLISTLVLSLIAYLLHTDKNKLIIPSFLIVIIVYSLSIYYAYLLINYTKELKDKKCECVSENFKYYIHNYGIFRMVLSLLPVAFILLALIILLFNRLFS